MDDTVDQLYERLREKYENEFEDKLSWEKSPNDFRGFTFDDLDDEQKEQLKEDLLRDDELMKDELVKIDNEKYIGPSEHHNKVFQGFFLPNFSEGPEVSTQGYEHL